MSSTSTSEGNILEVEGLSLAFSSSVHRVWSWKELFARAVHSPGELLRSPGEEHHVARDLSFALKRGDRAGLIGLNGTGKTSVCRCIAGIYQPDSGEIRFDGELRAVFDTLIGIQPELTGRENLELLARFMFPGQDPAELVRFACEFSELGEFLDRAFRIYSNGMQARLCLSLVAARPADLFILDEVFDGADAFFRDKISRRMLEILHQSGAVIFVSHSPDQIRAVCNRLLVMHEGRIVFDGDVEPGLELYQRIGGAK